MKNTSVSRARTLQQYFAECVAECFSTFMLVFIGEAAIAQYKFTGRSEHSPIIVNVSFGIGVYTGLMIAGSISGAHLNPAVTISLLTLRKIKPLQCVFYIIGQTIGAFLAAACVYFLYYSLFNAFDDGIRTVAGAKGTADIFFTMPTSGVAHWNSFLDQVVATALLMIFIMALGYKYNGLISEAAKPFAFVLFITAITSAFAGNCGAAINPARDLGPRIFAAFLYGWGNVFEAHNYFFWIPIIGPILGGIIGAWIFEFYSRLMDRFAYIPSIAHTAAVESHLKDIAIDGDDEAMLSQKLTAVRS